MSPTAWASLTTCYHPYASRGMTLADEPFQWCGICGAQRPLPRRPMSFWAPSKGNA